jgi:MFS transporter, DHA1 family, tetracycline resistance protein
VDISIMLGVELHRLRSGSESSEGTLDSESSKVEKGERSYIPILYVLFLEFLAISLTKSLIPLMLVNAFGDYTYLIVGIVETVKGLLAFISCPTFGRLSDRIGRKPCLVVTVIGTTMPICALAFTTSMYVHAFLLAVSGLFSATFPITFAYISDCVDKKHRAPAYGLALATFGLSFSLGPLAGSYIARSTNIHAVFVLALFLVAGNVAYIIMYLPETIDQINIGGNSNSKSNSDGLFGKESAIFAAAAGSGGLGNDKKEKSWRSKVREVFHYLPNTWDVASTFRVFSSNEFMSNLSLVVFLYYTSIWAIVSTLMVFVTTQLHFDSVTLGWLLSVYGIATMFSEGILVRIIVPLIGEINSIRLGLLAFSVQCICVAFSTTSTMIFVSVLFSMLANLVYPSISSLVSKVCEEGMQGEALGALNGIKALTEGFGPLLFGLFMSLYRKHPIPGAPYLLASILSLWALLHCYELPKDPELVAAKSYGEDMGYEDAMGLLSEKETEVEEET